MSAPSVAGGGSSSADGVPADGVPADGVPADGVPADSAPADSAPADDIHAEAMRRMERELLVLLRRMRASMEHLAHEVHPDLDAAAYGILRLIATGDASSVTELACQLGVGKPTVSRQVAALEQLGLLRRGSVAGDRRVVALELTSEGRSRLDMARGDREAQFRALLSDWTVDEVSTLGTLLAKLNRITF